MHRRVLASIAACSAFIACNAMLGIEELASTTEPSDAAIESSRQDAQAEPETSSDAVADGALLTPTPCAADSGVCAPLAGFAPAMVAIGNTTCAPGFVPVLGQSEPVAQAGACGCKVTATTPPLCQGGNLVRKYDTGSGLCDTGSMQTQVTSAFCFSFPPTTIPAHLQAATLPVNGGTCTADSIADSAKVTTTPVTACVAVTCDSTTCSGSAANCAIADGDVACPAGYPVKKLIGTGAKVACGPCACDAKPTCTAAKVTYYADSACNTPVDVLSANNACNAMKGVGSTISALKYTASAGTSPVATPGTPMPELLGKRTLCCK